MHIRIYLLKKKKYLNLKRFKELYSSCIRQQGNTLKAHLLLKKLPYIVGIATRMRHFSLTCKKIH